MKNGKLALALLSITMLSVMIGVSDAAPVRTPGVIPGDSFTYGNVAFYFYSNDPSAVIPPGFDYNDIQSFSTSVENVVGTNITCGATAHFANGTETSAGGWLDVDTGDGANMSLFFISANLSPGDSIYSGGTYQAWKINETLSETYPGGPRDINYVNITYSMSIESYYVYTSMNAYWDKGTGVLTKLSMVMNSSYLYTTEMVVSLEMTQSSKWVVPEFAGMPQVLLLFASLTIAVAATRRRPRKTP